MSFQGSLNRIVDVSTSWIRLLMNARYQCRSTPDRWYRPAGLGLERLLGRGMSKRARWVT